MSCEAITLSRENMMMSNVFLLPFKEISARDQYIHGD